MSSDADYHRQYYQTHRAELLNRAREYYQAHKAELAERDRRYREAHKAEIQERERRYRQTHRAEAAAYRASHKAEIRERERQRHRHQSGMADVEQVNRELDIHPEPTTCRSCGGQLPEARDYRSYCNRECYRAAFAGYRKQEARL